MPGETRLIIYKNQFADDRRKLTNQPVTSADAMYLTTELFHDHGHARIRAAKDGFDGELRFGFDGM
jgi:hypothetical protein